MTQENTKQEYMLPEDVDFTKPFKFAVPRHTDKALYNYDPIGLDKINITSPHGERFDTYTLPLVKECIQHGNWLVLKQPDSIQEEDMFGSTFRFTAKSDRKNIYTYTKMPHGEVEISWSNDYGKQWADWYTVKRCRELIEEGSWTILPLRQNSQQARQKQFDEESFKEAEQIVSEALKPAVEAVAEDSKQQTIQDIVQEWIGNEPTYKDENHIFTDGLTVYFIHRNGKDVTIEYKWRNPNPTFAEVVEELEQSRNTKVAKDSVLATIKKMHIVGDFSVEIKDDSYTVWWDDIDYCAKTDEQLLKLMDAIVVLKEASK